MVEGRGTQGGERILYLFTAKGTFATEGGSGTEQPIYGWPLAEVDEIPTVTIDVEGGNRAGLVSPGELEGLIGASPRSLKIARIQDQPTSEPLARTFMRLRNQVTFKYSPVNGEKVRYEADGRFGYDQSGNEVFPRLDPAVIGLVTMGEKLLLTRKPGRDYYSLVAGYVEPGETIEDAFTREVLEETGRRVKNSRYVMSAPWAATGSLMLGMHAETTDSEAVSPTDGELEETRWVTRSEVLSGRVPLTGRGSLARTLIDRWSDVG